MVNLNDVYSKYKEDNEALDSWCNEIYSKHFSSLFKIVSDLYGSIGDGSRTQVKFTDEELEKILTDLPLNLFKVSEQLNRLKVDYEMIKLKTSQQRRLKQIEVSKTIASDPDIRTSDFSKSDILEMVRGDMLGDELLLLAYSTVIERVESERSAVKELIMAVKKIWDSRRSAEHSIPVSEVVPRDREGNIPPYDPYMDRNYSRMEDRARGKYRKQDI